MEYISLNNKQYQIIKLLGHGKGGYSYLVTNENKEYVIKQIHHEPCDYYQFGNKLESEINDYHRLENLKIRIPILYEVDIENERILKEYIEGPTIKEIVTNKKMKEIYLAQIKEMCNILYQNNLNIDYYGTNFIVKDDLLYYIDYECNEYMEKWNFENWGIKHWI